MKTPKSRRPIGRIAKGAASPVAVDYRIRLLSDLRDIKYAAGYLTAALEEGEDVFLLAIRDVVEAQGRIGQLARATRLNRENLYGMLSRNGNPRLSSITAIVNELGLDVQFAPRTRRPSAA
jgi:probable addiction module antidote protein